MTKKLLFLLLASSLSAAVKSFARKNHRVLQKVPKNPFETFNPYEYGSPPPPSVAPTPFGADPWAASPAPSLAQVTTQLPTPIPATPPPSPVPYSESLAPTLAPTIEGPTTTLHPSTSRSSSAATTLSDSTNLTACQALFQGKVLETETVLIIRFRYELSVYYEDTGNDDDDDKEEYHDDTTGTTLFRVAHFLDEYLQTQLQDAFIRPSCEEDVAFPSVGVEGVQVVSSSPGTSTTTNSSSTSTTTMMKQGDVVTAVCTVLTSTPCLVVDSSVTLFLNESTPELDESALKSRTLDIVQVSLSRIVRHGESNSTVQIQYLDGKKTDDEPESEKTNNVVVGSNEKEDNKFMETEGTAILASAAAAFVLVCAILALKIRLADRYPKGIKLIDDEFDRKRPTLEETKQDTLESNDISSTDVGIETILSDNLSLGERGFSMDSIDEHDQDISTESIPNVSGDNAVERSIADFCMHSFEDRIFELDEEDSFEKEIVF